MREPLDVKYNLFTNVINDNDLRESTALIICTTY